MQVQQVLTAVRTRARQVEGDSSTSSSLVFLLHALHAELVALGANNSPLGNTARLFARALGKSFRERFSWQWTQSSKMTAAALLNPCKAIEDVVDEDVVQDAIEMLLDDSMNDLDPFIDPDPEMVKLERQRRFLLLKRYRDDAQAATFEAFDDDNVLAFWRAVSLDVNTPHLQSARRLLAAMPNTIKAYLSMPTTSASVERLFSCAGIVADGRSLGDERFEQETLLRAWLRQRCKTKLEMIALIDDITQRTLDAEAEE